MQLSVLSLLAGHTPKFTEHLYKENIKLLDFLVKMLDVKNAGLRSSVCKGLSALVLEVRNLPCILYFEITITLQWSVLSIRKGYAEKNI